MKMVFFSLFGQILPLHDASAGELSGLAPKSKSIHMLCLISSY
ncbi:hypothetical protein [Candidatus Methylacidithermus pantelleriae]|nr:hypothetical protein [Candidatus Methylacidithermus pantelleriae]